MNQKIQLQASFKMKLASFLEHIEVIVFDSQSGALKIAEGNPIKIAFMKEIEIQSDFTRDYIMTYLDLLNHIYPNEKPRRQ